MMTACLSFTCSSIELLSLTAQSPACLTLTLRPGRGVVWEPTAQQWAVQLAVKDGGEPQRFGLYRSEEAAARAHDFMALELFGPGAATNFATVHGAAATPLPVPCIKHGGLTPLCLG